ncbi:MAG: SIS domain-containing protein [Actinobacteria bacterium]|nr:SIS domain-containing protein [Actinomycetota bacterium]
MCGIICIVSRPSARPLPIAADLLDALDKAITAGNIGAIAECASHIAAVDAALRGESGTAALVDNLQLVGGLVSRLDQLDAIALQAEQVLEAATGLSTQEVEHRSNDLIALRDATWSLRNDRLRTAKLVGELAGKSASDSARNAYLWIQQSFSALDRMEVRGRDSAGINLLVWGHGIDASDARVQPLLKGRLDDNLFTSGSVRVGAGSRAWSFVYKAAAEIGELGDNTRVMRQAVTNDALLRLLVSQPGARLSVLGHTRWASVGIISEANAHPVNSEEIDVDAALPYLVSALNGDVDNHADIKVRNGLKIAEPITTDAKVIPTVVAHKNAAGADLVSAFRQTVGEFDGSVAIATASADEPNKVLLALRGSGQGLYVGIAEDRFIVASEPYGVVEETLRYVRMDGEALSDANNPSSRGQVIVLDGDLAGTVDGMSMLAYDGTDLGLTESHVAIAEVTTRDIDRGEHKHFLAKEIGEAPASFRKTLRGKIGERDGNLFASLDTSVVPQRVIDALAAGKIARIRVIGQGTAAIAGRSLVQLLRTLVDHRVQVDALPATELSGFQLQLDMSDTLVIAISQSGTTTDTNRTVDLARSRGASVLAIVNRRGSELAAKADGVLYTSDGRDVEMSVASTKAFYSQVSAGALLSCALSSALGSGTDAARHQLLTALRTVPDAMNRVLEMRPQIAQAARQFAPARRYWTVVGNGFNVVAAEEVRIKLSELSYKSIACDITEDKKHIDLSCEPLIFVCAAGLSDGTAADVAKEIAIFRAHKALPIVVATQGEQRFDAAAAVISVPQVDPSVAFILSVMVGHIFGYEAALAIDALARPLRACREVVEHAVERGGIGSELLVKVRAEIGMPATRFFDALTTGDYDGNLEPSTAVRVVTMLRDVMASDPLQSFQNNTGKIGSPEALLDDLTSSLTRSIDELTRPVDAIKHQAKTVTVGISRSDEGLLDRALVQAVLNAGVARDRLSYKTLKVIADLDAAVASIVGFTRYSIEGDVDGNSATVSVVDRGGISRELTSRVDRNSNLVGTKHRVASDRNVLVARGRRDGRTVIFVPETKGSLTTGITLLHVLFQDRLPAAVMRTVLQGYDDRFNRLVDWVTETEGSFREDRLAEVSVADLLILPITETADHWRTPTTGN